MKKPRLHWFTAILFYLSLLAIWQTVCASGQVPPYLFPSPRQVFERIMELAHDDMLWPAFHSTMGRMLVGFALSLFLGLVAGLCMGISPLANACFRSLLLGLQTLPSAAWMPIALLLFGLSDGGIYFVIVMSSVGGIATSVADGIANIPPIYLRAARTLGTPGYAMGWKVILPAALPSIATGVKLGWTLGWHGAVSAELIKSSVGLGFLLYMGRELNDASQVVAVMILTILIGLALDRLVFGSMEQWIRRRWGLVETR